MQKLINVLRQKGYRVTDQRKHILTALTRSPQRVADIVSSLHRKKIDIDKVTVYRTLDRFVELGVAGKTQFKDNTAQYELLETAHHHHHIVCDTCGSIQDIPLNEASLLAAVKKNTDFIIKSHSLEFYGICSKCQ